MTKAYKKLMIQPDKALDFIKKCDLLHKNKVESEKHVSGFNNMEHDESYEMLRIDSVDDISPVKPDKSKEVD